MAKKDYPELEGTKVEWIMNDETRTGIIRGCNFDIGITVQSEDNTQYFACINGPSAPFWKERPDLALDTRWPALFYSTVRKLKSGRVNVSELYSLVSKIRNKAPGNSPSEDNCPYN